MRSRSFDDLSRRLAEPVSRRGALRIAVGAVAVAAVPGLRPQAAGARRGYFAAGTPCESLCTTVAGAKPCGITGTNIYGETNCYLAGCTVGGEICCHVGVHSAREPGVYVCPKGYRCGTTPAKPCIGCPEGYFLCGTDCCSTATGPYAQVCHRRRCLQKCPPKTHKCGRNCCDKKQQCRHGKCCTTCGDKGPCCNPDTQFCCREPGDTKNTGSCCQKNGDSCCPVGEPGKGKRTCCAKPNKCVRELPRTQLGFTKSSPYVCCPPARQVPVDETQPDDINACCPPGQLSLGGKLELGIGVQGFCCDIEKICGTGADRVCCQTGQSCIGGTTCA